MNTAKLLRRVTWLAVGGAALLVLIAIIGFVAAPYFVKPMLERELTQLLHRQVSIAELAFNPFALSARAGGFKVEDRDEAKAALSFDELYVRASYSSLYELAPVVAELKLLKPYLRLVRNLDHTYNFQDLIDESLNRPKSDEPAAKFSLNNIQIIDGRIDFDDRPQKQEHAVSAINIHAPFVSNFDADVDIYLEPKVEATVNGHPLKLAAQTKPFKDSYETRLALHLGDVDLPRYLEYSPIEFHFKLPSGKLDAALDISFAQSKDKGPSLIIAGDAAVRELGLDQRGDARVFEFKRLDISIKNLDVFGQKASVARIALDAPRLHVRREKDGSLNVLALAPPPSASTASADKRQPDAPPFTFEVAEVAVTGGTVTVEDLVPAKSFRQTVENFAVNVRGLSSQPGAKATVEVSFDTNAPARLAYTGEVGLKPTVVTGKLEIAQLRLADFHPYYEDTVNVEVQEGSLDAVTTLDFTVREGKLAGRLSGLNATMSNVRARNVDESPSSSSPVPRKVRVRKTEEREPFLYLPSAAVTDGEVDLGARAVTLGEVRVIAPSVAINRERDGTINATRLLKTAKGTQAKPTQGEEDTPWTVTLRSLVLERGTLTFEDRAVAPPVKFALAPLEVTGENLSTAKGAKGMLATHTVINKRGSIAAKGSVSRELAANFAVTAKKVDILPFEPYITPHFAVDLTSGNVSAQGNVDMNLAKGLRARYKGSLTVANLALLDEDNRADLLKWQSLYLGRVDANVQPLKVSVEEIALSDFYSRLILNAGGQFNLQQLDRQQREPAAKESPPPNAQAAKPAPEPAGTPGSGKPAKAGDTGTEQADARQALDWLRIGRVSLQDGQINFSDFFIKPNYSANITDLTGSVSTLTFKQAGDVELRGKVDRTAPLEIDGQINPLAAELFLDIKASARDIELSPLTPYSEKYLGYGIEKGKLSVKVKYLLENRILAAENNVYLDQLTFGDKVDSPDATKLPVLLAVSLLKDRNGVIDVNLPISGSLDDPEFSIGGIIVRVILNLITNAVMAPFSLIASLTGGGEELGYAEFVAGSAALDAGAEEKLKKLAKALADRPGLKLDIAGRIDPAADPDGIKRASLERQVKQKKFDHLRHGGEPPTSVEAVNIEPKEYEALLTRAYKDAKFPKPRNAIGFTKALPVPEMEKLILANVPTSDEDLRNLANQRAQAVKDYLVEVEKISADRVFIVAPKLETEETKEKGDDRAKLSRVDFSLK
jgi:uncharacterized protein involved in outer membrane biogenesis